MFKLVRRIGRYFSAFLGNKFDEIADPKIQLTQAIEDAQDQHRKLKQQAANVIANQKQTELRLNRKMGELEQATSSARQAVLLADDAQQKGEAKKLNDYTRVAESLATRIIAIEADIESLKQLHYQTTQAATQAKSAVESNALALQRKLTERQKLLSQLDQAKMQEQLNTAMGALSERVGQDVPTLDQVRNKIEARYAKALGASEVADASIETKMLDVERAAMDMEARARLEQLRDQLGLPHPAESIHREGGQLSAPGSQSNGESAELTSPAKAPRAKPKAQSKQTASRTKRSKEPKTGN